METAKAMARARAMEGSETAKEQGKEQASR